MEYMESLIQDRTDEKKNAMKLLSVRHTYKPIKKSWNVLCLAFAEQYFVVDMMTGRTLRPSTEYFHFSSKWDKGDDSVGQVFTVQGSANH